jgi:GntR family transcriptional regulator
VASHNDPRALFRFLRLVPMDGDLAHPQSVPLDCWKAKAGNEAARMLGIELGAPVTILRLLRFPASRSSWMRSICPAKSSRA